MQNDFHHLFVNKVVEHLSCYSFIKGIALGGSAINDELDEYADLDIYWVVDADYYELDNSQKKQFLAEIHPALTMYQNGHDSNVLVSLYHFPPQVLHVDWKCCSLDSFHQRVEDPVVIYEVTGLLSSIIATTSSGYPPIDPSLSEQRFWSWMHYILSKLGRGETIEAIYYLQEVQSCLIGPLMLRKNDMSPRRMRRVEQLPEAEFEKLSTCFVKSYTANACFEACLNTIELYKQLRKSLFKESFVPLQQAEAACLEYGKYIKAKLQNRCT